MTQRVEHELHRRRLSVNVGVGLALLAFVGIVFGLTIAKVGTDPYDEFGAQWATGQDAAAANDRAGSDVAPQGEAAQ
ncbi:MAG: hypothetical protein ACRBCL_08430 [Maritimibacter sp.]